MKYSDLEKRDQLRNIANEVQAGLAEYSVYRKARTAKVSLDEIAEAHAEVKFLPDSYGMCVISTDEK